MAITLFAAQKKPSSPIINERGFNGSRNFSTAQYVADWVVNQIKNSPELLSILDTVVSDHFLGEVDFYGPDGLSALGPTQLKKAMKFWTDNKITEMFQGGGIDYLCGDVYFWHPTLIDQRPDVIKELARRMPQYKQLIDEEGNTPRKFGYLAASTVTIQYDLTDVISYSQNAQGRVVNYSPSEVTHIKLMEFNGEVNGMSGLKALAKELYMMMMLKENIISQLDNGGSPDSIIYLKNGTQMSKSRFDRLTLALESFSHIKNAHGNLAIDGDIGVHQLGANLKDMEYRELAMFILSQFLLSIGVPTTRISYLMTGSGGTANKGNLAGDSEKSYEAKINTRRLKWESILNTQVFSKLGFTFKFRRTNLQDEVRETQATQMRYASVGELQRVLNTAGKQLTTEALLSFLDGTKLNLTELDVEDAKMDMLMINAGSNPMNGKNKVTDQPTNVQSANSRARIDNATNRGISS